MELGWDELATPGSAVRLASVARHVTYSAPQPGTATAKDEAR